MFGSVDISKSTKYPVNEQLVFSLANELVRINKYGSRGRRC